MKSSSIRLLILFGTITIVGIIGFQMYWVKKTFDIHDNQFNQNVGVALYDVAEKLAEFNNTKLQGRNPVRQISSNYFIVEVNDFINEDVLDLFLLTEFKRHNIKIDYEYAIYDCYENEMVYGRYVSEGEKRHSKPSDNQDFEKCVNCIYYFGINFPGKRNYIVSNMDIWFISSFILFSAILFFAYMLFVIFRQKRLSEVQRDFINNMTHEFKTPISTIGISANVLRQKAIEPERFINYTKIILDQNKRLKEHVDKVLQAASVDKRKVELKLSSVDLDELINDLTDSFKPKAEELNGSLIFEEPVDDIVVEADRFHLTNIIVNLIDNAFKYSTGKPDIKITLTRKREQLKFCVRDRGIGIEKKYHKRIFTRFFRVPTGLIHNVKGFGLGLHYVRNIVRAHRWKITVESETGKGSSFCIIIPDKKR